MENFMDGYTIGGKSLLDIYYEQRDHEIEQLEEDWDDMEDIDIGDD